jgi:hypothetical protein
MDDSGELELEFELEPLDPRPAFDSDMVSCIAYPPHCSGLCGTCHACSV